MKIHNKYVEFAFICLEKFSKNCKTIMGDNVLSCTEEISFNKT